MTLPEVLIFSVIGMFLVGIIFSMWYFAYKNWAIERTRTGLRVNLEMALERIKEEARITSGSYTSLYKSGSDYTAISFPAPTVGVNGLCTLDGSGNIFWDRSIIYHVYSNELRRTEFIGNNTVILNQTNRAAQLASVITNGDGSAWSAIDGESSITKKIVKGVSACEFKIVPDSAVFDGYSATTKRSDKVELGSVLLDTGYAAGYHDFTFTVEDQNPVSTGYNFGIDSISIAPAGCEREAEFYDPLSSPHSYGGGSPSKQYILGFGGNNFLEFSAGTTGAYVNLYAYYDLWRESNFTNATRTNTILTGNDLYVKLADPTENPEISWQAAVQTGGATLDYNDAMPLPISMADITVRNVMSSANIDEDSNLFRVKFQSHSVNPLTITKVYLDERNTGQDAISPPTSNTRIQLYFTSGGNVTPGITISAGSSVDSNWAIFPIDSISKDYFVTFHISSGNVSYWPGAISTAINSYLMYDSAQTWVGQAVWSSVPIITHQSQPPPPDAVPPPDGDCYSSPDIHVTASMEGWKHTGSVVSEIYDTTLADPVYNQIKWSESNASDDIELSAGSSDDSGMSGATWSSGSSLNPHSLSIGTGRYFQFQAELGVTPYWTCINHPSVNISDASYKSAFPLTPTCGTCGEELIPAVSCPWVDDVTIDWPGPTRMCDISGYFAMKDDYGIINLTVDGNDLIKGFGFSLTISDVVQGVSYEESLTAEVKPRNTGK